MSQKCPKKDLNRRTHSPFSFGKVPGLFWSSILTWKMSCWDFDDIHLVRKTIRLGAFYGRIKAWMETKILQVSGATSQPQNHLDARSKTRQALGVRKQGQSGVRLATKIFLNRHFWSIF